MERGSNNSGNNSGSGSDSGLRTLSARRELAWRALLLAGAVLVLGSGFLLAEPALDAVRGDSRSDAAASLPPVLPPSPSPSAPAVVAPTTPQRPALVISEPNRLRIPRLGIDAPVTHIGLNTDGTIGVPKAWGDVGWFDRGPAPGAIVPSVLVGHYDSTTGPAVFYRLSQVVPGDRVEVAGAGGASQAFIVDRSEQVTKATFPSDRVYGPVTRSELRLITCGGAFDYATHHYLSNLIVYAHADTSVSPGPGVPAPGAGGVPGAAGAPGAAGTPGAPAGQAAASAQPLPLPPATGAPSMRPLPPATATPGAKPIPPATTGPPGTHVPLRPVSGTTAAAAPART